MQIIECEQYDSKYWQAKCGKPSCSEFNRIVTPSKWEFATGATTYMCELIAQRYDRDYGEVETYVSAAMKTGVIMEPESRRFYELERDCDVTRVGLILSDCGRFAYSPDALVADDGCLELKNPTAAVQIKWLLAGVVPPEHLAQCMGALLVTQRKWCDWMSYHPGLPPLLVRVTPDEKTLKLAEALEKFHAMLTEMRGKIECGGDPVACQRTPQESYF